MSGRSFKPMLLASSRFNSALMVEEREGREGLNKICSKDIFIRCIDWGCKLLEKNSI